MHKLLDWIDEQTGLVSGIRHFMDEPLAEKVGWPHIFGSLVLFLFGVQVATGILLMVFYVASPDHAYETVQYISYKLPFGSFVRGLHHWTASAFMIVLGLHLLQVYIWGAYKRPRQIIWVIGVGLLMVALGFSFTGYLLPWDQKAYWATVVGTNIAGSVPVIGSILREMLRGGNAVGAITLTRFFAIHVGVLPPIIVILILFHVLQVRIKGITPPWRRTDEEDCVIHKSKFWPDQVLKDAIAAFVALVILSFLALRFGAPIEPLANPADTGYTPRPEWYFLPMFELLKHFPGNLEFVGAVLLPGLSMLILAIFPYLDRNPERRITKRKYALCLCAVVFAGISYLGLRAVMSAPKPQVLTQLEKQGQKVFLDRRCQACHGVNGGGGNAGPDLAQSGPFKRDHLEALLRDPARFHPRTIMPPANLPDAKFQALVAYIMSISPTSRFPAEPQVGPRKPASHFDEQWYINHKFEVRKDPSQCKECHEPAFCQTCHAKRLPDSHLNNWLKFHSGTAHEKPEYCQACHEKAFCKKCHDKLLHTPDWLGSKHGHAAAGDSVVCFDCHEKKFCQTCHRGAVPASHSADWVSRHPADAKLQKAACMTCHTPESCTSCHGLPMPHPATWRTEHGAKAMQAPVVCAKCHVYGQKYSCTNCHTGKLRPSFHTPDFISKGHPDFGKHNVDLCKPCHGPNACVDCHGGVPMPHPANWALDHKNYKGVTRAPGSICYKCHTNTYCKMCHQ